MDATKQKTGFKPLALVISLLITLSIGAVAGFVTVPQVKGWYITLNKPSFNPPDWLFGPVWTVLYIMIAIAAYMVWTNRYKVESYRKARLVYFLQLLFNFSWSIIFFGLHQVFAALIIIVLLFTSIILNIKFFSVLSKTAAMLLIPYLLWVSFAGVLNLSIYLLNK